MIQIVSRTSIPTVSLRAVSLNAMVNEKSERLKAARKKAGFDTAADAARTFEWTESAYRHHENGTRPFGLDAAKKYGRAFRVKPGWLLGLENVDGAPPPQTTDDESLIVNGSVEAGAWRNSEHWNDDRAFVMEGMPSPVPGAKRFGLVVVGYSMDEFYEPGTVLDCVSVFEGPASVQPKPGDHVIVEQVRPDGLRELTVKEYQECGNKWLAPRSTRKEFKPIEYPGPDVNHDIDDARVNVIAFVIGAYPPRVLDLMRRMGVVRPLIR